MRRRAADGTGISVVLFVAGHLAVLQDLVEGPHACGTSPAHGRLSTEQNPLADALSSDLLRMYGVVYKVGASSHARVSISRGQQLIYRVLRRHPRSCNL